VIRSARAPTNRSRIRDMTFTTLVARTQRNMECCEGDASVTGGRRNPAIHSSIDLRFAQHEGTNAAAVLLSRRRAPCGRVAKRYR
jgi:hypothetical protein